jgi:hypothetical protein
LYRPFYLHPYFTRPQQLPGPAQEACAGDIPQQPVSPAPGNLFLATPDMEDGAESNLSKFLLLQSGHCGLLSSPAVTRISTVLSQSRQ